MKKNLREATLNKMAKMPTDVFQQQISAIHHAVFAHSKWKEAETVGLTVSRGNEIPTQLIMEKAWLEGKKVVVPKCVPLTKALDFRGIEDVNQLESVYYGLLEPIVSQTHAVNKKNIDLIIVPGVVFDPLGFRIGFGGGYYDRYLADYYGDTIALALNEQVIKRIPSEKHDRPVQTLITPQATFECLNAIDFDEDDA